jgi:hypothetical protein
MEDKYKEIISRLDKIESKLKPRFSIPNNALDWAIWLSIAFNIVVVLTATLVMVVGVTISSSC